MNGFLLKYYIKKGNSFKIKNLSEKEYRYFFNKLSFDDKIRLSHLRGEKIDDLDDYDLMINGAGLYDLLGDKDSLIFYLELLDYINSDVLFNHKYIKRFNIPSWKNKLEESGYFDFAINGVYNLIGKNQKLFVDLLDNDLYFRELFFKNVSFEGNLYELKIDKILSFEMVADYLSSQKEMIKFYNKKCFSIFYSLDASFFKNLPDSYKYLIGYYSMNNFKYNSALVKKNSDKIKDVLFSYFSSYLSDDEINDIFSLYFSGVSADNIASLISFIISDHDYYRKYDYLLNNYFGGDINKTILFCRKYNDTKLFSEICFNYVKDIDDKLIYLSSANRLKGIYSLDDIKDISIHELKEKEDDFSSYKDVKEDVRVFGSKDLICLNFEREIIIIEANGIVDEREVKQSHDQVIYDFIKEKDYEYDGPIIFRSMVITIANNKNVIVLIEGGSVICVLPKFISSIQKNELKKLFDMMDSQSEIGLCFVSDNEIYNLNNGDMMNSRYANEELSRIKSL